MTFGILKSLVLYLILSGLVLNFSPNSNYKRYIRFFSGLLILILLAEPIQFIFHLSDGELDRYVRLMESKMDSSMLKEGQEAIYNYYEMSLAESVKQTVSKHDFHVARVEVLTDKENNIVKCTVWITEPDKEGQEDSIKNIISDVYNLELARIYIVRR